MENPTLKCSNTENKHGVSVLREVPVHCQIGFGLSIAFINKVYEILFEDTESSCYMYIYFHNTPG